MDATRYRRGAPELTGREQDLAVISTFLDRARADGAALLLLGEPGVGKTLLLDAVAEEATAAGTRVLRAAGVEFEAEVAFAALNQALLPVTAAFGRLDAAFRDSLNIALGFGDGSPQIGCWCRTRPWRYCAWWRPKLRCWRSSTISHGLIVRARRSWGSWRDVCRGSRIGFLAASRNEEGSFFDRSGLPEHELRPLRAEEAEALLRARFPDLAPRVRRRVLEEAAGNPLAILELPAALSDPQRSALAALPTVLPLGRRLQSLFASRVGALAVGTRWRLLLAALDGTGDPRVLTAGGRNGGAALTEAERARLVYVDQSTHRVAFGHPLMRSAVVELSSDDERRRAHSVLAELRVDQPDRRAWHLAEATSEPDEQVACLLEQAAYRILRRGDSVGPVTLLTRASELQSSRP